MNNNNTKILKYQGKKINPNFFIYKKFVVQNNVVDVFRSTWKPKCHIKKISKNTYQNLRTKEVHEYMPKDKDGNHIRSRRSLHKIFVDLRQLINTNFNYDDSEKFLTLTYRGEEQTNDPKKIYKDLDLFNKKLKYYFPSIAYIHVVEPHGTGNFHVHTLLKRMDLQPLYVDYDKMREMWGHGAVVVTAFKTDNIGAYFIAYFSNLELSADELGKYQGDIEEKNGKKYIKGRRLDFYPDYMQIYRGSRNLLKPEKNTHHDLTGYKKTYNAMYIVDNPENKEKDFFKVEQWKRENE